MNTFSSRQSSRQSNRRKHTPPPVGHLPPRSASRGGRTTPRTEDVQDGSRLSGSLAAALFAIPFMLVIGFVFLLIATLVAYRSTDPHALVLPLSMVALGLTSLLGGLISARRRRGEPLLSGLLCGLQMNLLLYLFRFKS